MSYNRTLKGALWDNPW